MHYTPKVGSCTQKLGSLKADHTSMGEEAENVWKAGGTYQDVLQSCIFLGHGDVPTAHPSWSNAMTNIEHIIAEEDVMAVKETGSRRGVMLQTEQKNLVGMKNIIEKFSCAGDLVVNPCAATFKTAKVCMLLPQHRMSV